MCKNNSESAHHLFNECPVTKSLYRRVALLLDVRVPGASILHSVDAISVIIDKWYTKNCKKERSVLIISQFVLWRERCGRIFRDPTKDIYLNWWHKSRSSGDTVQ